jgi:hypothetical protein
VQRHGELYSSEYGWNEDPEALVHRSPRIRPETRPGARTLLDWWNAGRRIGCVFVVRKTTAVAKLRCCWWNPKSRLVSAGACRRMHPFARRAGYRRLALWTQTNAMPHAIYAAAGFELAGEERHRSFGHNPIAETNPPVAQWASRVASSTAPWQDNGWFSSPVDHD